MTQSLEIRCSVQPAAEKKTGIRSIALLSSLLLALLGFAAGASAAGPYEPNDALLAAAGPLAIDQTYAGKLEVPGDRDFFFFHVTANAPAQVTLTIRNLGGSTGTSDLSATISNLLGTPLGALPYVERGEERTKTVALPAQKYVFEISSTEGSTDAYSFSTGGTSGAFGAYGQVAAKCDTAVAATAAADTRLSRAKTRLQRATSRLRRSRYGNAEARTKARILHRRAQSRVRAARKELEAAEASQQPWCSIPQ